ncbi:MAG: hypothetical protein ACRD2W_07850, partial [Acidimicrobiales bacterium]
MRDDSVVTAKIPLSELLRQRTEMLRLLPRGGRGRLAVLLATVVAGALTPPASALAIGALIGSLP